MTHIIVKSFNLKKEEYRSGIKSIGDQIGMACFSNNTLPPHATNLSVDM